MPVLSKSKIAATFQEQQKTIFTYKEIAKIINQNLVDWKLARRRTARTDDEFDVKNSGQQAVFESLRTETQLTEIDLPFPYRKTKRYTWRKVETHAIVQAINSEGYFSHYSAIEVHRLTEQIPKTIYFNIEQPATGGGGTLTQEGIDRAFQRKCRVSNNRIDLRDVKVCLLNGQNTNRLGVETVNYSGTKIDVTDIHRTLIDATVRTIYAGGIGEVAKAYGNAANMLSIQRIADYLRDLNYTYPYHQAIGYYLERTKSFSDSDLEPLRKYPIEFDFYITYQLRNPSYNKKWRLFIPKGF